MGDDWRVQIEFDGEEHARELAKRLTKFDLPHDLETAFGNRVVVSRDRAEVFCYADTRQQAEAAQRAVAALASAQGWRTRSELRRWHPVAEEWEDPDRPVPHTESERAAEHAELVEQEREESVHQGFPDFEVRVRCPSRSAADALSEQLRREGIRNVQRWHFVVIGADDEDSANALAERVRSEAPEDTEVTAEASVQEISAEAPDVPTPFNNPFAVFGGLAG